MSDPKKVPPGHPDYDMEFERCRWEMAMDGATSQDVDAWARATYESREPLLSEMSKVEALLSSPSYTQEREASIDEQLEATKKLRDGYVGAMSEFANVEGSFAKIVLSDFANVMNDDTQKKQLWMKLHDKGVLSTRTLLDKLGLDYDSEVEQMRLNGILADMSLEQSRKANEESRDRTSEAISKLAAPAMVGNYGGVVYGTTTSTATTGTTIVGTTSSTGLTITFSGGYIIGYGSAPVTEAPKEPKQWRGSVHGMVRVEE